ncbi:MAG: hypothetical protein E4H14_11230 [Candidatus Thorarchaeota archaeon]|nr:MAG: hypothetical protein E4H14_11230 [Candidatus Thorarchaeota archaeon]
MRRITLLSFVLIGLLTIGSVDIAHNQSESIESNFAISQTSEILNYYNDVDLQLDLTIRIDSHPNFESSETSNDEDEMQYSTYIGGTLFDREPVSVMDTSGNLYVCGFADSSDFPTYAAYDNTHNGQTDLFLSKFDPHGELVFSTFIGGEKDDEVRGIVVDEAENIFITGWTDSSGFPLVNPIDSSQDGFSEVFVLKMCANGTTIEWSTFVGGNHFDRGNAIALDSLGDVYVAGSSDSTDFPTVNAYDSTHYTAVETVIFKISANGSNLIYSTFVCGNVHENPVDIAIDSSFNAYVLGSIDPIGSFTTSDFPTVAAYDSTGNTQDGYLLKLNSTGNGLIYSTFVGGDGSDRFYDLELDSNNRAFLCGYSSSSDLPITTGNTNSGGLDTLILIFNETATGIDFSTWLGGSEIEHICKMELDSDDNIVIAGESRSDDFPLHLSYSEYMGEYDIYVAKIEVPTGNILFATFLGGNDYDWLGDISLDENGTAYISGHTESTDFPLVNPIKSVLDGNSECFVSALYDNSDSDLDFLSDRIELIIGTNPNNNDTDSDLMPDGWEYSFGLDPLIDDSDDDLDLDDLTNIIEYQHGTYPNDSDSDNDNMPDGWEVDNGLDPLLNDATLDPDSDELLNLDEFLNNCNPQNDDSDFDLMPDGWEVNNGLNPVLNDASGDADGDSLTNVLEYQNDTDPNNQDSDSDSLDDYEEVVIYGTNPLLEDSDSDNMLDAWEILHNLDPLNAADAALDADSDGLTNLYEHNLGTNPNLADTDSDGLSDKEEVDQGLNPLVPNAGSDSDHDGLDDITEVALGTDPLDPDSDSDGLPDGWEVSRGLDPLQATTNTGEAIERLIITVALGFGGFVGIYILTRKFKDKFEAKAPRILARRPYLLPALVLFLIVILMASSDVYGPIDPGSNIMEFDTNYGGHFEVKDSPYLLTRVNVYVGYRMTVVETTSVTVTFTGPVTQSISLSITSTSYEIKTESDTGSITLPVGNYSVRITSSRTLNTKLTQVHVDARNVDQVQWLLYRSVLVVASAGILYIAYKKNVYQKYTPSPASEVHIPE